MRALLLFGVEAVARGEHVLRSVDTVRLNERLLRAAGTLLPSDVRSLNAIHLATAAALGPDLSRVCTYDARMANAATALGLTVVAPN
jgi:hypothetical protein